MKGASRASLSWQLISQTYRLHKVAYWKHVPPNRSTLLVIFMVYGYLTSPEAVWFLPSSSSYLNAAARTTSIWGREVMAALWDEYPPCLMCIQVMSQKIVFQMCVHIQKSGARCTAHTHTHTHTHTPSLTHTHTHTQTHLTLNTHNQHLGHTRTDTHAHKHTCTREN